MNDREISFVPPAVPRIEQDTRALGFGMASDYATGSLLRTLAASKPRGRILELGTGTGLATAWLLAGMDAASRLVTVETEAPVLDVARRHIGNDGRVTFVHGDGAEYLQASDGSFDLVFADAWPGKYSHLDLALARVKPGGFYVIDDMLPQANWPAGHDQKVRGLVAALEERADLALTKMAWSTGLILVVKTP
ncbi:MAG: class I SAM-dependent methyltransferase [Gemmatimonadetes bacterium]|nr:class I SAM-dependent methyltransferase [Gemmatimonadota bacterium]